MTAFIHLRPDPHYRIEAFAEGFRKLGHHIEYDQPYAPLKEGDVAVIWNKTARSRQTVQMAREGGGAVIVAENGYFGKDADGAQSYALALDGHNGSGRWFVGWPDRLNAHQIRFKDWRRTETGNILIADQRGIGSAQMASPPQFAHETLHELKARGLAPRVRSHPGRHAPTTPLFDDLADCDALVVWSSNCATAALIEGIPTFYRAPHIVTQGAALGYRLFEQPHERLVRVDPRPEAFLNMAWAQAFLDEIESGEALRRLMDVHAGLLPSNNTGLGL